jgi:hypothetical protein
MQNRTLLAVATLGVTSALSFTACMSTEHSCHDYGLPDGCENLGGAGASTADTGQGGHTGTSGGATSGSDTTGGIGTSGSSSGTIASGGTSNTGGASGVGGIGTGGTSTSGLATGGASIGGASTGGTATGGIGVGTGGVATGIGGIGTGGMATGGAGTGGFVSACNPTCADTKPVCEESAATCVECLENGNCPASRPACNPATHTCVGCMLDNYCSAPTPACNLATYTCVGCLSNANCSSPAPACNTATNLCVQCTKDTQCSGATPACNTATNLCVQCTSNGNCGGLTPLCDTAKNTCVECLSSADCKSPAASLCNGGTCGPCAANADCSHLSGTTVCKTVSASEVDAGARGDAGAGDEPGVCVQCTGTDYATCGQSGGKNLVCSSLTNTCSTFTERSAGLCKTCVSDAQCKLGEMCVEEKFNGQSVGYFCFYKQGDTANGAPTDCTLTGRPYSGVLKNAVSIDGATADICSLRVSTCTALNQFSQTNCTSSTNTANDGACGFAPGVDSKCVTYGTQHLCTTTCGSDLDCQSGINFTCDTGANPPVCTFQ